MRRLELVAPSRLHFGLLSFGQPHVRQFGGLGAMVDAPGLRIRLSEANALTAQGPLAERALEVAQRVTEAWPHLGKPAGLIEVLQCPPQHTGLGVGTQLSLGVARLLATWHGVELSIEELAVLAGRGLRSAVGLNGFAQGGLLLEAGQREAGDPEGTSLGVLLARVTLPEDWRFVLVRPAAAPGLAGEAERQAFEQLPPVPLETTDKLCRLAMLDLLPAAMEADFETFSRALFEFGYLAGSCFAQQQDGVFATAQLAQLIERLRAWGHAGVGQSSWGPTLFALCADQQAAQRLADRLTAEDGTLWTAIAAPNNQGARIFDA